jgi:Rrf2 family protein
MWISGTTQYAINAVLYVAQQDGERPVRVEDAARALGMPKNYLSKTLYALARAGILRSLRGPKGGFRLALPPGELSLLEIARPFEDIESRKCLLGRPQCGAGEPCALHSRWEATSRALQEFFRTTTVADLLAATTAQREASTGEGGRRAKARGTRRAGAGRSRAAAVSKKRRSGE